MMLLNDYFIIVGPRESELPSKASVNSLSQKLYSRYSVLVSTRNIFNCDFMI